MKAEFSGAKLAASYAVTSALAQTSTNDIRAAGCMTLTIVNNPSRRIQDFGLVRITCSTPTLIFHGFVSKFRVILYNWCVKFNITKTYMAEANLG